MVSGYIKPEVNNTSSLQQITLTFSLINKISISIFINVDKE